MCNGKPAGIEGFQVFKLLADAERATLNISPVSGEKTEAMVKEAYAAPAPVVARLRALYMQGR